MHLREQLERWRRVLSLSVNQSIALLPKQKVGRMPGALTGVFFKPNFYSSTPSRPVNRSISRALLPASPHQRPRAGSSPFCAESYPRIVDWKDAISGDGFTVQYRSPASRCVVSGSWLLWRQALINAFPASEAAIRGLPRASRLVDGTDRAPPFPLWENTVILFTQLPVFIKLL